MQPSNPSHALALVFVDELARCGVTDAVLAPGSRSAALAMALHDDPRIRLHVQVDERSAGFCALGIGAATGRPAAVVTTSGSAVANLHPAVVEADTGHVPLLLLTADRPPELRHTGANQAIDQIGIFGRAPRWQVELGVPEDRSTSNALWRATVCRAVAEATGSAGAPGPVHLNLPFREPTVPVETDARGAAAAPFAASVEGRSDARPWTAVERSVPTPSEVRVAGLAERIVAIRRGLIVVGSSPASPRAILALARAAGWPVLAEPHSGARSGSHAMAHAALLLSHERFVAEHTPELVVRIGRTGLSREVEVLLGPEIPQILLDPHGAWDDPSRAVSELIVTDVDATCDALADVLTPPDGSAWLDSWRRADLRAREVLDAALEATDEPSEPRTARDLGAALPDGSTLVVASSMPIRDLDRFLAPRDGVRIMANRGASGIDGFVSTTMGVALAAGDPLRRDRPAGAGDAAPAGAGPTVGLVGDLALLHDANGFLLAPDAPRVDVTFVIVDNDGGGIFSFLPQAAFAGSFERVFGTPHGRDLRDLARLHGLGYRVVETAAGLRDAVEDAVAAGGVQLVHVRTDRAANVALHRRLTAAVHDALDDLDA